MLMSDEASTPKVLMVDDDPSALFIYKTHLVRAGYSVECSLNVAEALEAIDRLGIESFHAVVSDYWMPGGTGFDLLRQVQQLDRTLAVIMITAEGEKEHVAESMREGAHNFLDKPVSGALLREATAKAIESTRRQRAMRASFEEASALGDTQKLLLGRQTSALGERLRIFSRPHAQAGGDFAAVYPLGPERFFVLVSDVSGHDLRAAYYASYMHGVAHGMLDKGAGMEEVFGRLNHLLLKDWNQGDLIALSCAACAAEIDLGKQSMSMINCGLPTPYLSDPDGWAIPLGAINASPLGWFDDLPGCQTSQLKGGYLCFWSDGLEDAAQGLKVDPLCLAYRLHQGGEVESWFASVTNDDVVAIQVELSTGDGQHKARRSPLLATLYSGADLAAIDAIQVRIEASLRLALQEVDEAFFSDAILCLREALINALRHGCSGSPDHFALLQAAYDGGARTLHFQITDDGAGHLFDFDKHELVAADQLLTEHRGLILVKNLASHMHLSARGNRLTMDFPLSSTPIPQPVSL